MNWHEWSESNADYTCKLLDAGLEGARSGGEAFLDGKPLGPQLKESLQRAVVPAAIGACLGALGGYLSDRNKSANRTVITGLLGGVVGLGIGFAWQSRNLAVSVASSAWKSIGRVRDEHWLEENPIDYA